MGGHNPLYRALLIPSSVNHVDFGSRVEFDSTFDGNGHGTRTAGSRTFGVTEGASITAVKMMAEGVSVAGPEGYVL